jgi:membrane-associated phospholipid phosphatase
MESMKNVRATLRSPLWAAALCWVSFAAVLALAYAVGPAGRLDAKALHALMALDGPAFGQIGNLLVHSADPLPLIALVALLFVWGWRTGRRREAVAAVAMVAAANVTGLLLQLALAHPRFYPVLGTNQVGTHAFPSGHATSAMSMALAAVLVVPPRIRPAVASAAAAYVFAVSITLLVLSWHLPSDVLGGLLVSTSFFFCAIAMLRRGVSTATRERARARRSPALARGIAVGVAVALFLILLAKSEALLAFARVHTIATLTAIAIMVVSAGLVASAAILQR